MVFRPSNWGGGYQYIGGGFFIIHYMYMDRNNSELETIKSQFDKLKETRLQIKQSIGKIDDIKKSIKENYLQYISRETQYYFGLDSFHFQNKAIEMQHENMMQLYHG